MKKRRAIISGVLTATILPIVIFAFYFFSRGTLTHPNRAVILSFLIAYPCWSLGGVLIVIWYFNKKYK